MSQKLLPVADKELDVAATREPAPRHLSPLWVDLHRDELARGLGYRRGALAERRPELWF